MTKLFLQPSWLGAQMQATMSGYSIKTSTTRFHLKKVKLSISNNIVQTIGYFFLELFNDQQPIQCNDH